jgi:TorA maturation chaperone TorD
MQLEFMSFLTAKEAYGREHQMDHETIALCRDAQKKFLREHLGRWSPAFARRLARVATDPALAAVAEFTRRFISAECAQFQLLAGSEDLLLRPVDEAAESLCASCGLKDGPPGASHGGPTI